MFITKRAIHRRTLLRGLGATIALPLLDGMVPALTAVSKTAARPVHRLGIVYVPNGIVMKNWTPETVGSGFAFTPTLKPLEPFRQWLHVLSGLCSTPPPPRIGQEAVGVHARASTRFLTDTPPKFTSGSEVEAGVSLDQIAALELGRHTQLASLEIALESSESAGTCDVGYSCAYTNTISWRGPTTPLPMEQNPRAVFQRLFGDSGSTNTVSRLASMKSDRSLLDSLSDKVAELQRGLGRRDQTKLNEYLEAVRDIERRIQKAEEQADLELPAVDQPAGIPLTFEEHAKLMFDLQVVAYQSDLTRVITFMVGREFSGRTYPELGVPDAHHPTSHHQNDPEKLAKLSKIDAYHTSLLAYYLERLRSTPEGDGSLLDNVTIIYGAGMSDGNSHSPTNLPVLLLGGGTGALGIGHHVRYPNGTPLANVHLTLLDKMGIRVERLGDSTGKLEGFPNS